MKFLAFAAVSVVFRVDSFIYPLRCGSAFFHSTEKAHRSRALFAEGGAPQYDKFDAILREAEVVGESSVMLRVETTGETMIDYQPGHVLALEIEKDGNDTVDEKNAEDAKNNGGWLRGPYTVSRATEKSFDILIKVVGEKSKRFACAESGTPLKFGGKFKVPIIEGIREEDTKKVVFVSTGVGVGPCIGAVEKALENSSFPPIRLLASYRTSGEIVCGSYLDELAAENPGKFEWKTIISSENGRLSANEDVMQQLLFATSASDKPGLEDTHYHLIGNGEMVNEWKAGLEKAGVPEGKVTIEMYFNHKEKGNDAVIDRIANVVSSASGSRVPALE